MNLKILRNPLEFLDTRNGVRLMSLLAAIAVWYAIRAATSNPTLVTDIPLTIQPPPDWTIVDRSTRTVDVAFMGTREDLRYLNRELIKATVDARSRTDSQGFTVALSAANINAPGNARIEFIRPATLFIRLDREITKQVPVKVETQNLLPDGYEIEKETVIPARVQLSGPAQILKDIEAVSTMPIDLDGRIRSINKRRIALVAGDQMAGVALDPTAVTLDLIIVERSVSLRFTDLPILTLLPAGRKVRADIEPEVANLTVKGRPELVKALAAEDIRLFVDAGDMETVGPVRLPIRAVLPGGISALRTEPATVTIELKE